MMATNELLTSSIDDLNIAYIYIYIDIHIVLNLLCLNLMRQPDEDLGTFNNYYIPLDIL